MNQPVKVVVSDQWPRSMLRDCHDVAHLGLQLFMNESVLYGLEYLKKKLMSDPESWRATAFMRMVCVVFHIAHSFFFGYVTIFVFY